MKQFNQLRSLNDMFKIHPFIFISFLLSTSIAFSQQNLPSNSNILIIMIDDLNDCITDLGGHAQSLTPNITRFAKSGVTFKRAYTNAPMCGPSRASLFTGVYPHHSNNYYQSPWYKNEVLTNTRTMMEQFKKVGYNVLGTGKVLHHNKREIWTEFGNEADYSPSPFNGEERVPHPDVPFPFSKLGWVDGSLGPFVNLNNRSNEDGKPLWWTTGHPNTGFRPMRYISDEDRDPTPDEINAKWAADKLQGFANLPSDQPFFMAVGFLRPHTPLVAPQKYFDRFPLDKIDLSVIKPSDEEDTYLQISYNSKDVHALRFGKEMFNSITKAYGSTEKGLKKWTQAYLACVAAVDDNVGQVLDALNDTNLKENTIVVLASDHGFHMGEKDYLYKNSLWEESLRVPLLIRVPGLTASGKIVEQTVSLIDVYPTLLDLCGISNETTKNQKGHKLDGSSMRHLLENPSSKSWQGSEAALSVVYAGTGYENDPGKQHYGIRTNQYRYILYNTGREELYNHNKDPYEWHNLAERKKKKLKKMRHYLQDMLFPHSLVGVAKIYTYD